ncbi:DUF998 domain-containing protein [Streptomyces sp. NBC_00038]|uniref:DUF998 domain-containing protein n=1 Tax=Streptomyces sp. NBC_00038 TaxID=2903615 RepID=UPI00225516FE|nr:DUF998 domain-containing protein [Streptomyces sp. NBC_00038]MCX5555098.1 DUF998 domain-containing protein [Streptomyces sp. NBC_00038]
MHVLLSPRAATGPGGHTRLASAAHSALTGSVALAAMLHLGWSEQVDPVGQTLSDYALHEGAATLFTACAGFAAAGSAALLAALLRSRLPVGAVAPAALGVGCAGLSLCAVFRTDEAGSAESLSGLVHRHAAGASLAALPAAGLLLARRLRGHRPANAPARRIRQLSWASSGAALLFLGTHVSASRSPSNAAARVLGLAERVTLGLEIALLFAVADALRVGRSR